MADWKVILEKLVKYRDRLPGHLREDDGVAPPSDLPWPEGLPTSPTLEQFYALCDGGPIGKFTIAPRADLEDLRNRAGDDEYEAGRYLMFGDTEYGHPLVWDSREDRVGYNDDDGAEGLVMTGETGGKMFGLNLAQFFEYLFTRPRSTRDEGDKHWAETLDALKAFD